MPISLGNPFPGVRVTLHVQQAAIHEVISQACHRLGITTQFEPIGLTPKLVPMDKGFWPAGIYSECQATPIGTDPGCGEFEAALRIGFDGFASAVGETSFGRVAEMTCAWRVTLCTSATLKLRAMVSTIMG